MSKERVLGKACLVEKLSEERAEIVARRDTSLANAGRKAAEPRNTRTINMIETDRWSLRMF